MDLLLGELLDPQRCHDYLLCLLHPHGLRCPNGHPLSHAFVHKRDRAPILNCRCKGCGRCFSLFTGTMLRYPHYQAVQLVQLLHGIAQGRSTLALARETGVDRIERLLDRPAQLPAALPWGAYEVPGALRRDLRMARQLHSRDADLPPRTARYPHPKRPMSREFKKYQLAAAHEPLGTGNPELGTLFSSILG